MGEGRDVLAKVVLRESSDESHRHNAVERGFCAKSGLKITRETTEWFLD